MNEEKSLKNMVQHVALPNVSINKKLVSKLKKQLNTKLGRFHLIESQIMDKD
ncbi:hypothetical protein SAMN05443252_105435 [Bacillus sp. OV322]|uniref:hypothetical protein n=1 Tax=Bacillus sp. OV322 TaxID=1882764 RepID=UPI0008EB0D6D|nr:hypothetical protein [Bacillus sp. OV322]SFC71452.1 hypothetical protein SAMN05443252_105435 [Bacillus sp. OV322]